MQVKVRSLQRTRECKLHVGRDLVCFPTLALLGSLLGPKVELTVASSMFYCTTYLFFERFYLFIFRERGKVGEKHQLVGS